jgi:hypothetical protein
MKPIIKQFIAKEHRERVIIEDDFGNISDHKYDLVVTVEDPPGSHNFQHVPFDIDSAIAKEFKLMAEREAAVREQARQRGHLHQALETQQQKQLLPLIHGTPGQVNTDKH